MESIMYTTGPELTPTPLCLFSALFHTANDAVLTGKNSHGNKFEKIEEYFTKYN